MAERILDEEVEEQRARRHQSAEAEREAEQVEEKTLGVSGQCLFTYCPSPQVSVELLRERLCV